MKNAITSSFRKILTVTIVLLLICTTSANAIKIDKNRSSSLQKSKAFVLTTNYLNSSFSIIDQDNPEYVEKDIASTHGDDEVKYYDGKIYVVNRVGYNSIEVFDTENDFNKISEISIGEGTNPQDIAFISKDKAYVSCYDKTDLLIINPTTGEHIGYIDLSEYADDDGIPEMYKMVEFKFLGMSRVFLTIQRLDRNNFFAPTDKSYIVEIDGDNDKIIRSIALTGTNPSTAPVLDGIYIVVGETGSWSALDGGIERINIFTNKAEGFVINESQLGGNIIDFEIYPKYTGLLGFILSFLEHRFDVSFINRYGYAVVSDLVNWDTSLVSFDLKGEKPVESIYLTSGYQITDITTNEKGILYLSDRSSSSPGVRLFDVKTGKQKTSEPVDVGMYPPVHITFL